MAEATDPGAGTGQKHSGEGLMLLSPAPGLCQECAVDHASGDAHNRQSLYYQYQFHGLHGRWPTWRDAIAHCAPELRESWEKELRKEGAWNGGGNHA